MAKSNSYTAAGVNIDLADNLLEKVLVKLAKASRPEVLAPIGGFGGLFQIDLSRWREPVLVASVDGVGTKLMVAAMMNRHTTVGHDIVNHCINDISVQGAEPVFFMDYIGIGRLRSPLYEEVLGGVAEACQAQNVAVLGGETAEMPGMYGEDYDLVGCIVGIVEKPRLITGARIRPGHVVIAVPSNGPHTNGYSLARKILFADAGLSVHDRPAGWTETLGDALLKPHTCYWPAIREALARNLPLDGIAHITGGGVYENIPRVIPEGLGVDLDLSGMDVPPVFRLIQEKGRISSEEMHRVFNMGVGMVFVVPEAASLQMQEVCRGAGFVPRVVGQVVRGNGVRLRGIDC